MLHALPARGLAAAGGDLGDHLAAGNLGRSGGFLEIILSNVEAAMLALRAKLKHLVHGDGIRVRIVETTSIALHVYATRVTGPAALRRVQVHLGGAKPAL